MLPRTLYTPEEAEDLVKQIPFDVLARTVWEWSQIEVFKISECSDVDEVWGEYGAWRWRADMLLGSVVNSTFDNASALYEYFGDYFLMMGLCFPPWLEHSHVCVVGNA